MRAHNDECIKTFIWQQCSALCSAAPLELHPQYSRLFSKPLWRLGIEAEVFVYKFISWVKMSLSLCEQIGKWCREKVRKPTSLFRFSICMENCVFDCCKIPDVFLYLCSDSRLCQPRSSRTRMARVFIAIKGSERERSNKNKNWKSKKCVHFRVTWKALMIWPT